MTGILIAAHGSRAKETENTLNSICAQVKTMLPNLLIKIGYMEFNDVNIEKGLQSLVNEGATDINVIPYFLFDGMHIRKDIPEEIAEFAQKNPNITVTLGKTLGDDSRLAQIVRDRIEESL